MRRKKPIEEILSDVKIQLDPWQEEVLNTKGNICLRSGRQVGKSTIIGLKAAKFALSHQNKLIMVISKTERQAGLLFSKILGNIQQLDAKQIKLKKDKPTKHKISLKNGSIILCLPCGDTGFGIMGFTIDLLIADEAAFIPEEVWNSVIPSLAITRGAIWLLSTPFIKEGYYYECFEDPSFTSFHMSSEDCPRKDQQFLDHKKATLTKAQYAQMYLGEFRDEVRQFFSDDLIKDICVCKKGDYHEDSRYYLGVDIARMGEDVSAFEILEKKANEIIEIIHIDNIITSKTKTTDTTKLIIKLDNLYKFEKILIDSSGVGAGVLDQLLLEDEIKRRVIGVENAKKSIDYEGREKKILKEDLYNNLHRLMERKEIVLLEDDEVKSSLKSVQFEYNERGRMIIGGNNTHIAEGLIRAALCSKDKDLNIWLSSIKI